MHWPSFFWGACAGFAGAFLFSVLIAVVIGIEERLFGSPQVVPDKLEPMDEDFEAFV